MISTIADGLHVRPATWDDLESVLHLITDQNMAHYGEPMVSPDSLRQLWQSPEFDLGADTWAVITPRGRIAGYAELRHQPPTCFYPSVYIATGYHDRRIGPHLLQRMEARAIAKGSRASHLSLICRVSERNQAGRDIVEEAGYTLKLSFLVMEIGMAEPPPVPQWPAGVVVGAFMVGQDEQATFLADEEASADKGYHQPLAFEAWAQRMNLREAGFDPRLWFLARDHTEIAGVALNAYSPATGTGWIDHLGVRRPWRRRGIATALLLHSFGEFHRRGVSRVRLSVDSQSLTNAPRLYERVGMRTIQQYHIYHKELAVGNP